MFHQLKMLEDYTIMAADGELGPIREFYFDDFHWVVRYVAVDVEDGSILLSPAALRAIDPEEKTISLDLDLEFILNSPRFDLDEPVTRVRETELHNYFDWPFYWIAPGLVSYPLIELESEMKEEGNPNLQEDEERQHLRSVRAVLGNRLDARDGDIGHIEDFLIDDRSWNIMYLIVDTGSFLPGRRVLVTPQWVQGDITGSEVQVDLNKETIANSPVYDPSMTWDEESDRQMREYYNRDLKS